MIVWWLKGLIIANLTWLVYQDFSKRSITLISLIILLVLVMANNYFSWGNLLFVDQLINLGFLLLIGGLLTLYIYFRFGSLSTWQESIGLGDLLFLLIGCGLFCFYSYLIWLNISFVFALMAHFTLRKFPFYGDHQVIPLAGLQSLVLIPFVVFNWLCL